MNLLGKTFRNEEADIYSAAPGEGGAGDGVQPNAVQPDAGVSPNPSGTGTPPPASQPGTAGPALHLSREELEQLTTAAAKAAATAVAPKPAATPQRQITPEERDNLLRRYKVSKDYLVKLGYAEPTDAQIAAYQEMSDKTAEHAYTMAELAFQHKLQEMQQMMEQRFAPFQAYLQQQEYEQHKTQFFSKYPGLAGQDQLCGTIAESLLRDPRVANMQADQVYEAIAKNAELILKQVNPNFSLATPLDGSQGVGVVVPQGGVVPAMASRAPGGRSQGSAPAGASAGTSRDEAIYS